MTPYNVNRDPFPLISMIQNPHRMWQSMQGSLLMVVIRVLMASEYMHCYERERDSAAGN